MNRILTHIAIWITSLFFFINTAYTQSYCSNISFETGTTSGWVAKSGVCCPVTLNKYGIVSGSHTIMKDTLQKDALTGYALPKIPSGKKFSLRLGSELNGKTAENMSYSITVDKYNALISIQYAVVLMSDSVPQNAQFNISIKDKFGRVLDDCLQHNAVSAEKTGSFYRNKSVLWQEWSTVNFDLSDFIGESLTIELTTNGNGVKTDDYCYAYIVPSCGKADIVSSFCENDNWATLVAPAGFLSYTWSNGMAGRTIRLNNPEDNSNWSCVMKSLSGCSFTKTATLNRTSIVPSFRYEYANCDQKQLSFTDMSEVKNADSFEYNWNFGDGKKASGKTVLHQFDSFGSFPVTLSVVALPSGCAQTYTQTVVVSALPKLTISGKKTICSGSNTTLTVAGANSYLWSTGDTTATIRINKGGKYSVAGKFSTGCNLTASAEITVDELPLPTVSIAGPAFLCEGGSVSLTASGADTYLWNNGATSASISVSKGGVYSVVGSNISGCSSTSSFSLKESENAIKLVGDTFFCAGSGTSLRVTGAVSCLWSTGTSDFSEFFSQPGTYSVTATSAGGCIKTITFDIVRNEIPQVSIKGDPYVCSGGTQKLTASGAQYYIWSSGETGASIDVSSPGTYSVVGFNGQKSCSATAQITLTSQPSPDISVTGATTFCKGDSSVLVASGAKSYLWSNGSTDDRIIVRNSGTYKVTGFSENGCSKTIQIQVVSEDIPLTIVGGPYFCKGDSATLVATGASTYLWSTGETGTKITVKSSGTYWVKGVNANGCEKTTYINMREIAFPSVTIVGNPELCTGGTTVLKAVGATNYLWSTGERTASIVVRKGGTYSVNGYNETYCPGVASVTVVEKDLPVVTISGKTDICEGEKTILTAEGAEKYQWSTGETSAQITVSAGGTYSVTGTNSNGCGITKSVFVNDNIINIKVNNSATYLFSICKGDSISLTLTGGTKYIWENGSTGSRIFAKEAGVYRVTAFNAANCSKSIAIQVVENEPPTLFLNGNLSFCTDESTTISATGGISYVWSTGTLGSSARITKAGNYWVRGTDAKGCTATKYFTVTEKLFAPAAITGKLTFCEGDSTILKASTATSYLWSTGETTPAIVAKSPGIYSVTCSYENGCSSSASVTVNQNSVPLSLRGNLFFCENDSTLLTASGAISYLWSTGKKTNTLYIKEAGDYWVKGISATGCEKVIYFAIRNSGKPTVSINGARSLCTGSYTQLTASGGNRYLWSTGDTTATISIYKGGTYKVSAFNSDGCSSNLSVNVTEYPLPALTVSGNTELCENGNTLLTASGASSYLWNTGETTPSIWVNKKGYYTVTGKNENGCISAFTIYVDQKPISLLINNSETFSFTLCEGDSILLRATGAKSYRWSTGENSDSVFIHTPGTYTITAYNAFGCSKNFEVYVSELKKPDVRISGNTTICSGENTRITASGATQYRWSTGESGSSVLIYKGGDYWVRGTGINLCEKTIRFTIRENPLPVITFSGEKRFCTGDSTLITANGAATYLWSNKKTSPSIYVKKGGTYTVTGTLATGCSKTASVTIEEVRKPNITISGLKYICSGDSTLISAQGANWYRWSSGETTSSVVIKTPGEYSVTAFNSLTCDTTLFFTIGKATKPVVNISGPTEFCFGDSIVLQAIGAQYYLWSTGEVTDRIHVRKSGTYSVTGFNSFGCFGTASIRVNANLEKLSVSGNRFFCPGDSTRLTASGADSYSWSTGQKGASIYVKSQGLYKVTGTLSGGCAYTLSLFVSQAEKPVITVGGQTDICVGEKAVVSANGAVRYVWSNGDTARTTTYHAPGDYTVTGYNAAGCETVYPFRISEIEGPELIITGPAMLCPGTKGVLTASGYKSYLWSNGKTTASIQISLPGEYSVTGTSASGCKRTTRFVVSDHVVVSGNKNICKGDSTTLTAQGATRYKWSTGDTTSVVTFKTGGLYSVTGYGPGTCITEEVFTVVVNEKPYVSIRGKSYFTTGESITLTAVGAAHYHWSTGDTTATITVKRGGIYSVTGFSASDCSASSFIHIIEYPLPVVSIRGSQEFCTGDSLILTATGAYRYQWNTGATTSQIVVRKGGTFSVTGFDDFGNSDADTLTVVESVAPIAKIIADRLSIDQSNRSVNFYTDPQPLTRYEWFVDKISVFNDIQFNHIFDINNQSFFEVKLIATSSRGCKSEEKLIIPVEIKIPNTFTPNGDGINDLFMPGEDVKVFNRQGQIVYEGKNGWDGFYKGKMVPKDTYYYIYKIKNPLSKENYKAGYITVIY